jgi:NADP-dependent 3-hydroxy acid dehydrogenase YdfG
MTARSFHAKSTALEVVQELNVNLDGKLVLITGGTSGISIQWYKID